MERPGTGLRRELGTRDLTLFAIASIVGVRWVAAAAHAGTGSILLWLVAALVFLIPLANAVATLTARDPGAGGVYLWARRDFGPWHGFLAFWIYWLATVIWFPGAAMFYSGAVMYALDIQAGRWTLVAASLGTIWLALGSNMLGVRFGKWTGLLGTASTWTMGVVFAVAAALVWRRNGSANVFVPLPSLNFDTMSFWASIAFGMTGIELAGMMGAEIRDPATSIRHAARISSIFTTLFYAGTTAALLVILPAGKITELNGLGQAARQAGNVLGAGWLGPLVAGFVLFSAIGQFAGLGSAVARMPFAAGADHLLPAMFSLVHPKWGTPHVSMMIFGTLASGLLLAMQLGDTAQAAYETIVSLTVIAGFLPFVYVFGSAWREGQRLGVVAGGGVTVLAIGCALIPGAEIHDVWLFEAKLLAGTAALFLSAAAIYRPEKLQSASD